MTRVLVDMDGVVVDWTYQYHTDLEKYYPHLVIDEIREFSTPTDIPMEQQIAINWVKYRPGFYRSMRPIEGAIDGLQTLVDEDYDVWFCSSPEVFNASCESDKKSWIMEHLGDEWAKRLILTRDKTLVRGDFLIDDRPDVHGVAEPEWEQILFDQPYNDHIADLPRMMGWSDIHGIIDFIESPVYA